MPKRASGLEIEQLQQQLDALKQISIDEDHENTMALDSYIKLGDDLGVAANKVYVGIIVLIPGLVGLSFALNALKAWVFS
jgi:hypothetical protein